MKKTAILVDGAFFIHRYKYLKNIKKPDPATVAHDLWKMCMEHLNQNDGTYDLYRIFYYDCYPYDQTEIHPLTGQPVDFTRSEQYAFQMQFLEELKKKRKVALRLGVLERRNNWILREEKMKELIETIQTRKNFSISFNENDFVFDFGQKRVDIKIGLDIATLALKKLVSQIILVSADSDFVPAAKLARTEGIDFVLDPMWSTIKPDLAEHIDGLISKFPRM